MIGIEAEWREDDSAGSRTKLVMTAPVPQLPRIVIAGGNPYHANMPPIIACHTNCYGHFGAERAIENVRAAGLEWIELPIRTAGFKSRAGDPPLVTTESSSEDLRRVDQLLARHGVQVSSCTCMSGNPLEPPQVGVMRRKLDLASHFGVQTVVADAGIAEDQFQREQIYSNLREIGNYADKLGITVCFETHRGLCVNHREMRQVMIDLDHPRLKINFDTGNILYYNEEIVGEVALAKICHFVKHVHLKDMGGGFGEWNFPTLGTGGRVGFLRVYQLLRDSGFKGPFSIEIEGVAGEPELTLTQCQDRIVRSVKFLRELGYFD